MNYAEISEQIKNTRAEIAATSSQIKNTEESIREITDSIDSLINNKEKHIQAKKEEALNQGLDNLAKPYNDEIEKLKKKQLKLKEVLDSNTEKYSFDYCAKKYKDEYKIIEQSKDALDNVEELGSEFLGENFSKQLYASMKTVQIQPDNLDEIVYNLKKYKKNLNSVRKKSDSPIIKNYLDIFLTKVNPYKGDTDSINTNSLILYACCCLVFLFSIVLFGSWIYLIALSVLVTINLSRNYFIYKMLYYSKVLDDNTEEIISSLENKVNKDRASILNKLNDAYNQRVNTLETQIAMKQTKLRTEKQTFREQFIFNDSEIQKEHSELIKNKQANKKAQERNLDGYRNKRIELQQTLTQLQNDLEKLGAELVNEFLDCDKYGTDFILRTSYVFDERNGKPVFWDFPSTSCLFIHDSDIREITNFIKLISIQIINTMNPFAFSIDYWDTQELGTHVQCFAPLSKPGLFNIESNANELKKCIESSMQDMNRRISTIMAEYNDITQYNEAMQNLESVTESYRMIFVPTFNKATLTNEDMLTLIKKGDEVGIYSMVFITEDELKSLKDDAERLIDKFKNIYEFDSFEIKPKPAALVLSRLQA